MLKIFSTQLFGMFKRIDEQEEEKIEDCSRLLAQTITGNGTVHIKGFGELEGIASVILNSEERLPSCKHYEEQMLEEGDCVLAFSRNSGDEQLQNFIQEAETNSISVVSVAAVGKEEKRLRNDEFHIDTKLLSGLVPDDDGNRSGYPYFILALFVYYGLYFNTKEMLSEFETEF